MRLRLLFTGAVLCMAITIIACLSHTGIVSKRIKISSNFFIGLVALPLWFSNTTYGFEILTGRGACHSGGLCSVLKRLTMAVLKRVANTLVSLLTITASSVITLEFY